MNNQQQTGTEDRPDPAAGRRLAARLRADAAALTDEIVDRLRGGTARAYRQVEAPLLASRVAALLEELCEAVASRQPLDFAAHVGRLAARRRSEGYALADLQAALNALQAAGWRRVADAPLGERQRLAELERLTATVGASKDLLAHCGLARRHLAASSTPALTALFKGTISGPM